MIYLKKKNNLLFRKMLSESIGKNLSVNCQFRNDATNIYLKNDFTGEIVNVSEYHVLLKSIDINKRVKEYLIRIYDIFDYCIY
jgi:DNA repair exonuclease SbcCD ATPase subunit